MLLVNIASMANTIYISLYSITKKIVFRLLLLIIAIYITRSLYL